MRPQHRRSMASRAVDALSSGREGSQKAKPRNLASVETQFPHVPLPLVATSPWQTANPMIAHGHEFP